MLQLIVSSIQYSTAHKLFVIRLSVDVRVSCLVINRNIFFSFYLLKISLTKKSMHTKCKKKQNPISIFCFVFEKIHTSQYVYSLLVYLSFFTYVICYLQIVNMKKEKKIFETVYFSRLLCIKLNPKKNQAGQKFTDHILVLSH